MTYRLCLLLTGSICFAAKPPVTIDMMMDTTPAFTGHASANVTWSPDGTRFVANENGLLSQYDVKSGKEREIVSMSRLDAAAVKVPVATVFDWTNRRVGETNVQWFADGKRLLVAASGDLFIVDVNKGSFEALTQTDEAERDPKLSPDNRYVSFRRGPDLYTIQTETKRVTRLTSNGSKTLLNGELDWVYPEELALGTAHWWSPDSQSIAYLQFDTSQEPVFPQVSLLNSRGLMEPERYPKAGDPNAEVRLGIVPAHGGATKWMDLGETRGYLLARVVWSPNSREILTERLNRVQNRLELLLANSQTGTARTVLHEEDKFWINVQGEPEFLGTGDRFIWSSERSGFRHLYLVGVDGKVQTQLTNGEWEVDGIAGVDRKNGRVFFTSNEAGPLERQLYAVDLDGGNKLRLSSEAGTHAVSLSPVSGDYVDDFSSVKDAPRSSIHRADGSPVRVYREPESRATEADLLPVEMVTVKASDGSSLNARMVKPAGFRAGVKYPAVVIVYGGPGVQAIHNVWQGPSWEQVLAQKGFVVWQMDNHGSTGRGHAFESVVYHKLGERELADQKEGIQYLVSQGFVDAKRIGMYGWSYGGFMTLYTVTHAPGLIRAAIAGAPVTNWRNYDSIYTERYMGLPDDDEPAYKATSPQTAAAQMEGTKLLMIHNAEDDNVHFQNSLQMANAFENAGKQFFMLVYSQKSHGVTGPARRHLLEETTAFFEENLK